jgi:signal transduction histidine kinase
MCPSVNSALKLNKIRGEKDRLLNGLNSLQKISLQISHALTESEIFQNISPSLFKNLGYPLVLIGFSDKGNNLKPRFNIGYKNSKAKVIFNKINSNKKVLAARISSADCRKTIKEKIVDIFGSKNFIICPIVTKIGNSGFVFIGNNQSSSAVTQGSKELVTILTTLIGQSVDNAYQYDKLFRQTQETEIKVMDRTKQLAVALDKINTVNKKKTEFVSAVSHELRTPLTSIKGYASIIMSGEIGVVPDAVKERLTRINTHTDNLVNLINDLLDIARIESGRQEMKFKIYNVKKIVDNILDLLMPQITAKNIKLQTNLSSKVENIYVDITFAERVFINLISNAIKFTPQNGSITVDAQPDPDSGYVTFSISDTGIGIPAADLKKLFSEFFRVDNEINRNVKGTGLGLILAKNIIKAHRGKMWAQSQIKTGTTFFFSLPSSQISYQKQPIFRGDDA